jgi:hypothetical protein
MDGFDALPDENVAASEYRDEPSCTGVQHDRDVRGRSSARPSARRIENAAWKYSARCTALPVSTSTGSLPQMTIALRYAKPWSGIGTYIGITKVSSATW